MLCKHSAPQLFPGLPVVFVHLRVVPSVVFTRFDKRGCCKEPIPHSEQVMAAPTRCSFMCLLCLLAMVLVLLIHTHLAAETTWIGIADIHVSTRILAFAAATWPARLESSDYPHYI